MSDFDAISVARTVIQTEIDGLQALADQLDQDFVAVVNRLKTLEGHVILTGIGKSGHVARKIAATLASTGTPSFYIHPTEASHGDMGMITQKDCVIALSRSGETRELADLLQFCKRRAVPLMAMTCKSESTLANMADFRLILPDVPEACAVTGAPTTSTTLQMALGDALAVALLQANGFSPADFKAFHPGGTLGAHLKTVSELMHEGADLPLVSDRSQMDMALEIMSAKGFGCVGIVDQTERLAGIITDGDIRRNLDKDLPRRLVHEIMTTTPKTVTPETLAVDALRLMTEHPPKVMQVFVVQEGKPVGILHMHDLLRAGLG